MSANEENVQESVEQPAEQPPPERDWEMEARHTGWVPREEFRGDPQKWIDARSYVERGETFIPLLRKSNSELQTRLGSAEEELINTRRLLSVVQKEMEELKTESKESTLESAEARKGQLYDAIAQAREENDVRKELQLREQLDDLNLEMRQIKAKPTTVASTAPADDRPWERNPIHQQFMKDNPWFGLDQEKTSVALGYMNYLNSNPETKALSPQERYSAVDKRIRELYPGSNPRRSGPSRVEGGRPSGGRSGGDFGPRFEDLPAAAREQCDKQAPRFVGKMNGSGEVKYKTLDDYRAHFTRVYNDDSWGTKQMTGGK